MLEEFDIKALKVEDLRKLKEKIEKMPSVKTESQYQSVFAAVDKITQVMESFSQLNENVRTFFIDNLVYPSVNFIVNHKLYPSEYISKVEQYFEHVLAFIISQLDNDHLKLSETLRAIFDPSRMFYEYNSQETDTHKHMSNILVMLTLEYQEWVQNLKDLDFVDCIKHDKISGKCCWSRGQIMYRTQSDFSIRFQNEQSCAFDRILSGSSAEIMPYKSRTPDYETLLDLSVGDLVDACDTTSIWINSTITFRFETTNNYGEKCVEYMIAYRVYDQNGSMEEDNTKLRYNGWSKQYDEIFRSVSPKLAIQNSRAKSLYKAASVQNDETIIDDSNDLIYLNEYNQRRFYAILRPKQSKSTSLVRIVNAFGNLGGFQRILDRIQDTKNWLPINLLAFYVQSIGNIHAQLYRRFVLDYVPEFKVAVTDNLLRSPEGNIRNMAKDKLDQTIKGLENLVRRAYSLMEKFEFVESLCLQLVLLCFNSNFLDKKIQALKFLIDVCKCVQCGTYKSLTIPLLLQWINNNQLFEQILSAQTHLELVSRSSDLLKFYLSVEGALSESHMEQLWSLLAMNDKEFRPIIYKVFQDISIQMKDHHVVFFQNKITTLRVEDLGSEQIALLYEMNRFQSKNQPLVMQCIDVLWGIVKHQSKMEINEFFQLLQPTPQKEYVKQTAKDIEEKVLIKIYFKKARTHVCDLFKNLDSKDNKMNLLNELLENLQQHQAVSSSLKSISHLIQSFPSRDTDKDHVTQGMIVGELIQERKLVIKLLDSLAYLKDEIKKRNVSEKDWPIPFQASYMLKLLERVSLIKTLIKINNKTSEIVTLDFLNTLWNMMVLNPLCKQESDMACKWIKELVDKEKEVEFQAIYYQFFSKTFISESSIVSNLQIDGFETFQTMMCRINEHKGHFKSLDFSNGMTQNVNNMGVVTSMTSAPQEEDKPERPDFEYQVDTHPSNLAGISFLWDVVYTNTKDQVIERAAQFLTKLYINPTQGMSDQRHEIQSQFIKIVLDNVDSKSDGSSDTKSQTIRSLLLIKNLLNESERLGVGSLTSLSGLVRGELMKFQIANELTNGNDVPKKVELQINSNKTVMQLRLAIAKKIQASWDQIKLIRVNLFNQNREVPDTDNGKTLLDIRLRNGESLMVQKRQTQAIPLAQLTTDDKQLTAPVKEIVKQWFKEFQTDGQMSQEQCIDFIYRCTNEKCSIEDSRIKDTYDTYDSNKDGYLSLDDFTEFYTQAALERPYVVWKNIHAYHYRNDLKRIDEFQNLDIVEENLPRYIFQNHSNFYDTMFRLFDDDKEVALEVWRLLNRLPASQSLLHMIVTLEGIKDQDRPDWSKVFPQNSPYRLLYTLKIIEYLMSDDEDKQEEEDKKEEMSQIEQDYPGYQPLIYTPLKMDIEVVVVKEKTQSLWRQEFIAYGGFEQLSQTFKSIVALTHKGQSNTVNQQILSFILLVMKNYLAAALKPHVPDIYKIQQYIRQTHYTLEQISINLKLDQEDLNIKKPIEEEIEEKQQIQPLSEYIIPQIKETFTKLLKTRVKETDEFMGMVERLKGELGQIILKTLDLRSLYQELIFIIQLYLSKEGEIESEERQIVEYGLSLFASLILYDTEGCQKIYLEGDDGKVFQFLQMGLFTTKNILIRKMFSHVIYLISKYGLSNINLKYMLKMFPTEHESNNSKRESSQYFDTLCKLIEEQETLKDTQLTDAFQLLSQEMTQKIQLHQSCERRQSIIPDKTLCGYLGLLESILKVNPHLGKNQQRFAEYLFKVCLFEADAESKVKGRLPNLLVQDITTKDLLLLDYLPDNYVKCKSAESRKLAYKVLTLLIKSDSSYFNVIKDSLSQVLQQVPQTTQMNYKPQNEIKSYHGFVGIKNLGCICYMNAMIQQFYMTPAFRYAMLMASDGKSSNLQPYKTREGQDVLVDDNIIHQFQKLFAYLEYSDRPDYNPFRFCFAFKDFQGKPVNVAIQQDAQEFLNMIFDKLENGLADKGWKQVVEGVYGGKTCNQVICKECNQVREQEEMFYNLSVQVKGVKHLHESLKHLISGETISDFYCEFCMKKNDIIRRQCLSQLPNALIIHLQRIVFNLDTLQNEKMSNRVEFPNILNLEPYTREGLQLREVIHENDDSMLSDEEKYRLRPKDYYEYKLKGVVVHRGTAVYGHYYSYINHKQDKWLEFNDSNIKDYDARKIGVDCYGGKDSEESSEWSKGETSSTSAYILIYERNYKQPIKMQFKTLEDKNNVLQDVLNYDPEVEDTESELECNIPYNNFGRIVKEDFYKEVWLDNHLFMLEKHVYTEEFFNFVRDMLIVELPSDYLATSIYHQQLSQQLQSNYVSLLENGLQVLFELAARSQEITNIKDFVVPIKNLINLVPMEAHSLLKKYVIERSKRVFECFIQATDSNIRITLGQIILHLINVVIEVNELTLDISVLAQPDDATNTKEKDIINFMVYIMNQLNQEVAKNWTKLSQYLELIRDFVQSGPTQLKFGYDIHLVSILIDFFLEKGSPLWAAPLEKNPVGLDFGNKKHQMGNKFTNPFFLPLFQCLAFMLNTPKHQLSQNDLVCLHHPFFYSRAITQIYDLTPLISIIIRMCWNNSELSLSFSQLLLDGIEKANYESVGPYCQVLVCFMSIADNLIEQRVQWVFGYPQPNFHAISDSCACPYSLSDASIVYHTTLPADNLANNNGLLSIIYNNRKRYENYIISLLKAFLHILNNINQAFAYVIILPPPSYLYGRYVDWIGSYIETYYTESKKYQSAQLGLFNRVQNGQDALKEWQEFEKKLNQQQELIPEHPDQWDSITPIYILGQCVESLVVCQYTLAEGLTLSCVESTLNLTESKPMCNPPTNAVFPSDVLYDNQFIQTTKIDPMSTIWDLLMGQVQLNLNGIPVPPPLPLNMMMINQSNLKKKRNQQIPELMEEEEKDNIAMVDQSTQENNLEQELSTFVAQLENINYDDNTKIDPIHLTSSNDTNDDPKTDQVDSKAHHSNERFTVAPKQADLVIPLPCLVLTQVNPVIIQSNFLRRYYVKNTTDQTVFLKLNFDAENPDSLNFRLPQQVCKVVKPQTEFQVICLMKMVAELDWGYYNEIATATFESELKGESQQQDQENKNLNKTQKTEGIQVSDQSQMIGPNLPNYSQQSELDMKSCPVCTVLQTSSNHFCELCGSDF